MKPSNDGASPRGRWSGTTASIAALAMAAASSAFLAAGCSSSSAKVAQVSSTQSTTTTVGLTGRSKREALVAFSACMRKHGVPKFPDPEVTGSGLRLSFGPGTGIDPNTPFFKTAERACRRLLPNGGKSTPEEQARHLQDALDYARCIREHGVPTFPDPKASGDGSIEWGAGDTASPQFKAAQQACRKLPGGLPLADEGERP
jgi:hypothetical protein